MVTGAPSLPSEGTLCGMPARSSRTSAFPWRAAPPPVSPSHARSATVTVANATMAARNEWNLRRSGDENFSLITLAFLALFCKDLQSHPFARSLPGRAEIGEGTPGREDTRSVASEKRVILVSLAYFPGKH